MNAEKFGYWFRFVTKWAIPAAFLAVAVWPDGYWLAGVMTIAVIFAYVLEANHIGDEG